MENIELKNKISETKIRWMNLTGELRQQKSQETWRQNNRNNLIWRTERKIIQGKGEQSLRDVQDNRKL